LIHCHKFDETVLWNRAFSRTYVLQPAINAIQSELVHFSPPFLVPAINPFLNYAIPDDNATPSPTDVTALVVAYEKRLQKPRLEYIAQLAPTVEEVLIDAGFRVEGHLPLMTCGSRSEQILLVPPGIELILPVSDADLLATVAAGERSLRRSSARLGIDRSSL
jgi:hypothetical protein